MLNAPKDFQPKAMQYRETNYIDMIFKSITQKLPFKDILVLLHSMDEMFAPTAQSQVLKILVILSLRVLWRRKSMFFSHECLHMLSIVTKMAWFHLHVHPTVNNLQWNSDYDSTPKVAKDNIKRIDR